MARLPVATRESVPEGQRTIFDEMVKGLGAVPRYGPGSVLIHVPKAHQWATLLNHYLRDESSLPKKIQELAMLVTARELDCQHIWNAHAASGVPLDTYGRLADTASVCFSKGLGTPVGSVLVGSAAKSFQLSLPTRRR